MMERGTIIKNDSGKGFQVCGSQLRHGELKFRLKSLQFGIRLANSYSREELEKVCPVI